MGDGNLWVVDYDNDVGPDDDGFREWWTVSYGEVEFTAKTLEDATWLCFRLNAGDERGE